MHPSRRGRVRKAREREQRIETELGVDSEFLLTRSPIRTDDLPDSVESIQLDWAPDFEDVGERPNWFVAPLLAAAVVFALRLLPQWTGTTILYLVVGTFGVVVGLFELSKGRRKEAFGWVLGAALAVLVLSATNPLPAFLLLAVALILSASLVADAAHHTGDLLHADMLSANEVRTQWRRLWKPQTFLEHITAALPRWLGRWPNGGDTALERRDSAERAHFDQGFLAVAVSLLAAFVVLIATPIPLLAGIFALLTGGLIIWGFAWFDLEHYRRKHGATREQVTAALQYAQRAWFSYGAQYPEAPGVYHSPHGDVGRRHARTAWTFRLFAAAVVLLGAYFPLLLVLQGPGPWQEADLTVAQRADGAPTLQAVANSLPESTQLIASKLPEDTRGQYLSSAARLELGKRLAEHGLAASNPLQSTPETWVVLSAVGLLSDPIFFGLALALGVLGCAFVPGLLFRGVFLAVAGRSVAHHYLAFEGPDAAFAPKSTRFSAVLDRIRTSDDKLMRTHLWLGEAKVGGHPVLLDRRVLHNHAHIMGGTESGKTSRGLAPLIHQLIGEDCSVVVLDLKGDQTLFEEARDRAAKTGCTFKWFTSESGESTFVFNPLAQPHMASLTPVELADIYTRSLGLDHGEGYGRIHFSRANRTPLLKLLQLEPEIDSFARLALGLDRRKGELFPSRRAQEHGDDLVAVAESLALVDALNVTAPREDGADPLKHPLSAERRTQLMEHAIEMDDLLREPSVYYFKLPGALHTASDREIGKFALNALLTAAYKCKGKKLPVYLVIDEFQMLVSEDLRTVLDQARSMGIYVVLSNQSPSQLGQVGKDLLASIEANTGFKQIFSIHDDQYRRVLSALSGETIYVFTGMTQHPDGGESVSMRQEVGPRHRANDFITMSARDEECMVHIKKNTGYSQFDGFPFIVYPDFHIDEAKYNQRKAASWPAEDEHPGTMIAPLAPLEQAPAPTPKKKKDPAQGPESRSVQQDLPLQERDAVQDRLDAMDIDDE